MTDFEAFSHGRTVVTVEGRIIHSVFKGSFNREAIVDYAQKIRSAINAFEGKPFAVMVDDVDIEGGTPDAYDELNQLNKWVNEQVIVAKAFIIESAVNKQIILERTPEILKQKIDFFVNEDDARAWLIQQLEQAES